MPNIIEINGERYVENEKERPKNTGRMSAILAMSLAMGGGFTDFGSKTKATMPRVNIANEYALIQQKKSNLSRSQRDWVEYQFHQNFTKISQP